MNILFLLYSDDAINSAAQIYCFADELNKLGHECILATPDMASISEFELKRVCPAVTFQDTFSWRLFKNEKHPDIIHAWTPRERLRKQALFLRAQYQLSKLIIHLEDNEDILVEAFLGVFLDELKLLPESKLMEMIPPFLSNPVYYKEFLEVADGITIIMDKLDEFLPDNKPNMLLWPSVDVPTYYSYNDKNHSSLKKELGINDDELVICYPGSVHPVNKYEVRSLYLAIALANREGIQAKLIRTGDNYCNFLGDQAEWASPFVIELGLISKDKLLSCLAISDILIQPGKAGKFNDYRLPSKIPEFLAMGKPVMLPNTNIGRYLKDEVEALVLQRGDGLEILEKIKKVYHNKELIHKLSHGAHNFAVKNFDKSVIGKNLENFYYKILGKVQ